MVSKIYKLFTAYRDHESYDVFSFPLCFRFRSTPPISSNGIASVQLAARHGCRSDPRKGAVMKNPYEVLRAKEQMVDQLRRETEVLQFVIGLLDREDGADTSPAYTPSGWPAVYLLTNSGRLEVVAGDTPRLRFAGRMRMPVEVTRIGDEFHIFVPTPQPSDVSSGLLEEGAA
jgi:hypothetical protein